MGTYGNVCVVLRDSVHVSLCMNFCTWEAFEGHVKVSWEFNYSTCMGEHATRKKPNKGNDTAIIATSIHTLHPTFQSPCPTQGDRSPPVLVVDGYNFLHQWRSLCHNEEGSPIGEDTSMEDARDAVVRALEVYSQFRGVRVVVVFDAMSNPLGSSR